MATYKAPVRDMRFVLYELLDAENAFKTLGFEEATADVIDAILDEGAKFCETVLFPINRIGDQEGCKFENGVVTTPSGFATPTRRSARAAGCRWPARPSTAGRGSPIR